MRMVRHPLDAGIGEDHVEVGRQLVQPRGHVAQLEIDVGIGFARCLDHDRRAVDAENLGMGIALAQHGRAVARPAANIQHARDAAVVRRQLHRQITRRLRALPFESQILFRIPGNHAPHANQPFTYRPILSHNSAEQGVAAGDEPVNRGLAFDDGEGQGLAFAGLRGDGVQVAALLVPASAVDAGVRGFEADHVVARTRRLPFHEVWEEAGVEVDDDSESELAVVRIKCVK